MSSAKAPADAGPLGGDSPRAAELRLLADLADEVASCRRCDRLVGWREHTAAAKRAAFADEQYWGRGVPGFGDPAAAVVLVGLAPAAHGANRTGRMFTGDRSGDFLYAALHRCGFANQPASVDADDGLRLRDAYVTAAVRCAPPANKPSPAERDACRPFLERELTLLSEARVAVALGGFAYGVLCSLGAIAPRPRFGHGATVAVPPASSSPASSSPASGSAAPLGGIRHIVCSYHPSQQNTFTGRLTPEQADTVLRHARALADLPPC